MPVFDVRTRAFLPPGRHAGPDRGRGALARAPAAAPATPGRRSCAASWRASPRRIAADLRTGRRAGRPRRSTSSTSSAAAPTTTCSASSPPTASGRAGAGRPGRGDRARQRAGPGPHRRAPCTGDLDGHARARRGAPTSRGGSRREPAPCAGCKDGRSEGRPDGHLRQRRDVPRHGQGRGDPAAPPRGRGRLPAGADLLRAADGQHRLPRRGGAGGAHLRRRVRGVRRGRHAVGLVRRVGAAPALDRRPTAPGTRRWWRRLRETGAAGLRAQRVPRRRARRDRRRRVLPAPGDLPPDLPLAADARRRRPAAAAARGGARASSWSTCRSAERVLRLRRHLRGQERRHLGGDGRRQGPARARDRRRGAGGRRQLLPDAHRRAALAPARRRPRRCTSPRSWPPRQPRSATA